MLSYIHTHIIFVYILGLNSRTARVLLALVVPGHLIFMLTIHLIQVGHTSITLLFASSYLTAAVLQVGEFGNLEYSLYCY